MKSRTPSDFAIVAIFRDKRKPQNAVQSAFPLDFMGIFRRPHGAPSLLQGGFGSHASAPGQRGESHLPRFQAAPLVLCVALNQRLASIESYGSSPIS
jgi:hypothetical protein